MADPVTFDHSLYSPSSVESAASAYSDYLNISLSVDEGKTTASFTDLDEEHGLMLVDAFCNHVLFETIQTRRAEEVTA